MKTGVTMVRRRGYSSYVTHLVNAFYGSSILTCMIRDQRSRVMIVNEAHRRVLPSVKMTTQANVKTATVMDETGAALPMAV